MQPIADALDILQGEKNVSMGYLLPTITVLKNELEAMINDQSITECKPLVRGLLAGIDNRYISNLI